MNARAMLASALAAISTAASAGLLDDIAAKEHVLEMEHFPEVVHQVLDNFESSRD